MDSKKLIYSGMLVGGAIGGFAPTLWGDNYMSFSSVIFTAIGGFLGIWVGFKLSRIY